MTPSSAPHRAHDADHSDADHHTSAARLHGILTAMSTQRADRPLLNVWAHALGVDPADKARLLERVALVGHLVAETRDDITQRLPSRRVPWFLEKYPLIEQLVDEVQFTVTWNAVADRVNPVVLDRLWSAHLALDAVPAAAPKTLPADTVARFRARAEELLAEVLAADLPQPLRRLVVDHLEALRRALLMYELEGIEGLEQAVTFAMGMGMRESAAATTTGQDIPPVVRRAWSFTGQLSRAVDWARHHPAESIQIGLSLAQVGLAVAQLAAGTPPAAGHMLSFPPVLPPVGPSAPLGSAPTVTTV